MLGHLAGLAGLMANMLADITDALALVGFGRAHLANVGGDLADEFLVAPGHSNLARLGIHVEGNSRRGWNPHRMGEADIQDQVLSFQLRPITDAFHLELAAKASADAKHHVVKQGPRQSVQGTRPGLIRRPFDPNRLPGDGDLHVGMKAAGQLALGSTHLHVAPVDFHLHAVGQFDRHSTDARHLSLPSPNLTQDFAADAELAGARAAHHAFGSREDRHADSRAHPRDLAFAGVDASAGSADTLQPADPRPAPPPLSNVLEMEPQHRLGLPLLRRHLVAFNVAFLLENPGDGHFDLRRGKGDDGVTGQQPVAYTSQHIGNRIGKAHPVSPSPVTNWPSPRPGSCPPGPARGSRCGTWRNAGYTRAAGRRSGSDCAPGSCTGAGFPE